MGRVLVTRRLPDGGLDPLADHELIGPNADDAPFSHDELVARGGVYAGRRAHQTPARRVSAKWWRRS
jgi:hypothetical protein